MRERNQGTTYQERVMTITGLMHLTKLFNQGQIVSALFVIDVSIESQLLCFKKQNTGN